MHIRSMINFNNLYGSVHLLSKVSIHTLTPSVLNNSFRPTVYALSTPAGIKSAISVVRITGQESLNIYKILAKTHKNPKPRQALLRNLYTHPDNILLDNAIAVYFQGPKSYTGEDMLELHLHGSKSVVNALFKTLSGLNDIKNGVQIRMAEPGEFSKRGFLNGKMDLTELEGIRDIIDSETEIERRSALKSFIGENKILFKQWRATLLRSMAQMAAIIDFSEEADIENVKEILQDTNKDINNLHKELFSFISKINKTNLLKSGIKVALIGEPNVGKSSLINKISSNDDLAIVSDIPGTTRDSIDSVLDISGYKVVFSDTAGIRSDTLDEIEIMGILKSKNKFANADIVMLMVDPTNKSINNSIDPVIVDMVNRSNQNKEGKKIYLIINKCDVFENNENYLQKYISEIESKFDDHLEIVKISCKDNKKFSVETLVERLEVSFQELTSQEGSDPILVSSRVQEILREDVMYGIVEFKNAVLEDDVLIASENLNIASNGLAKITGESIDVDEVLGTVFSSFCIGK
ncbi:hypothetical protein QEN19_002666 [Hanseniaspora menglaensis]